MRRPDLGRPVRPGGGPPGQPPRCGPDPSGDARPGWVGRSRAPVPRRRFPGEPRMGGLPGAGTRDGHALGVLHSRRRARGADVDVPPTGHGCRRCPAVRLRAPGDHRLERAPGARRGGRRPLPARRPGHGRTRIHQGLSGSVLLQRPGHAAGLPARHGVLAGFDVGVQRVHRDRPGALGRHHVVVRDGRYYLFFSTQRRTFHPDVSAPTGLYGFVGPTVLGPYEPLNGSGLVLRTPPEEPFQAYSWLVLNDLRTVGFVDWYALHGHHPDDLEAEGEASVRRHFGGTMTPVMQLGVDGDRAWIAEVDTSLSNS